MGRAFVLFPKQPFAKKITKDLKRATNARTKEAHTCGLYCNANEKSQPYKGLMTEKNPKTALQDRS